MARYLLRRFGISILTIAGMAVIVFLIVRVMPGDAAAVRAGPYASDDAIAAIRAQYGLDLPLYQQFLNYIGALLQGNLGISIRTNQPVLGELMARLPASLEMAIYTAILATILGTILGVAGAWKRGTILDAGTRVIAVLGSSMATFWLGLLLIYFLFFRLGWFPGPVDRLPIGSPRPPRVTGLYTVDALLRGDVATFWQALRYLALPVITLGFVVMAPILKMVRQAMIETLESDYVRTAWSLGVRPRQILLRDGLRNALLPVVTTVGLVFGYMIGGNVIIEVLFSWPGVGRYAYEAIQTNDLEALQGFVILVGILYVLLNVVVDLLYAWIDPRIRLGGKAAV
jgi:ABC-type dipeptide/oligopeptide/nickel transport system permease component